MALINRFALILLLAVVSFSSTVTGNLQDPKWETFNSGLSLASKEKKYVLLDFYADWCSYCKMMEQTTYKDSEVLQELNKHFVTIKVDTEGETPVNWEEQSFSEKDFSIYMEVSELPTLVFLDPNSEVIGHYPSFVDKALMVQLLKYISSGSRESGLSFDEFLESSK